MTAQEVGTIRQASTVVTIEDVAAAAGVSVATVSRAMRGLPNVAPATRARVVEVAERLDYVANTTASRLAAGRRIDPTQNRVGAIAAAVPLLDGWFFAKAVAGIEAVLTEHDLDLLLLSIPTEEGRRAFLADHRSWRQRCDSVILVDVPLAEDEARHLSACGCRLVTMNSQTSPFPSVMVDEFAAVRLAVQHLVGLGRTRLGLVAGEPHFQLSLDFTVPWRRRQGFELALAELGLEHDPELTSYGGFSVDGGLDAGIELLSRPDRPDAVFAMSDEMAIGVQEAARRLGLRIPEDVALVGFDDHDMSAMVGLTTVRQPVDELGAAAARLAIAQASGPAGGEPDHHRAEGRLVIRRSA